MIKTVLKHIIYETCIDVLFNKIINNFPRTFYQLKKGDMFLYIKIYNPKTGKLDRYDMVDIIDIYGSNFAFVYKLNKKGKVNECDNITMPDVTVKMEFKCINHVREFKKHQWDKND